MTPPFRTGLEKGNNSISAFIPTLPGGAFKGGGKCLPLYSSAFRMNQFDNSNLRR
jgi:hypothetical protein